MLLSVYRMLPAKYFRQINETEPFLVSMNGQDLTCFVSFDLWLWWHREVSLILSDSSRDNIIISNYWFSNITDNLDYIQFSIRLTPTPRKQKILLHFGMTWISCMVLVLYYKCFFTGFYSGNFKRYYKYIIKICLGNCQHIFMCYFNIVIILFCMQIWRRSHFWKCDNITKRTIVESDCNAVVEE